MSTRGLPRGRNALPLEEVARLQRERLTRAMAEVLTEKGYAATSVEDVLKRSGVSRLTFYKLFSSKADCFIAALDRANEILRTRVAQAVAEFGEGGDALRRTEYALDAYFRMLEEELPFARVCLVEIYAAGPVAVAHRSAMHEEMAALNAQVLGVTDAQGLRTCRMLVSTMITQAGAPIAENDIEGLRAIRPDLMAFLHDLWNAGLFGKGTGPS
ncbi:TetR family transcriptional regulator [Actinocorallia herbida]|uniref:TetR family transcriptional regulator n=1 Tax=Actinocorallia herbida TaxID=58109 RepID=A0A3N1DD16_9ACTN|nr:TetR/AcrR family transcriptional regulator [Actinocorallia herbida]ROO91038.1 TetR family transcriptional regulator [Actinocorallia herbida]